MAAHVQTGIVAFQIMHLKEEVNWVCVEGEILNDDSGLCQIHILVYRLISFVTGDTSCDLLRPVV